MNRLAIIAVTGVLALVLTACGEQTTSEKTQIQKTVKPGEPATTAPAPATENKPVQ